MKINTFEFESGDIQNLRLLKEGMTIQRLTTMSEYVIQQIVDCGGQAKCDGENIGYFTPQYNIWLKFTVVREDKQLYLVDHSFKQKYKVTSLSAAREMIRGY